MQWKCIPALTLCLAVTAVRGAEKKAVFQSVSLAKGEASALGDYSSSAAMWIWTDKVVYQPGEQLTLRWTVKSNNDFYPYTIVAYRLNNQTGARSYLPGNTATIADVFGRTAADGFDIVRVPDATKPSFKACRWSCQANRVCTRLWFSYATTWEIV